MVTAKFQTPCTNKMDIFFFRGDNSCYINILVSFLSKLEPNLKVWRTSVYPIQSKHKIFGFISIVMIFLKTRISNIDLKQTFTNIVASFNENHMHPI